ncbi:tetratricopeptide repeat family protein [Asticcacaulis biprosthecium C19]|uniref:Tetratricopeptide repeat family protein n=2 Tax=Asticcacaulis biprosthecium TaxID=76891 RepID=F4QHI4_9CAUL|nr:tetratricopeptide repeat family protein [Asticcacaulis biprosthecium C19]
MTPFVALVILALVVCALAALRGEAPILTNRPDDWFLWVRAEKVWGGVFACAAVLAIIGILGMVLRLFSRSGPKPVKVKAEKAPRPERAPAPAPITPAPVMVAPAAAMPSYVPDTTEDHVTQDPLHVPTSEGLTVMPPRDTRGSLKFDAHRLNAAPTPHVEIEEVAAVPLFADVPVAEMPSLEPAIFHDNASDSFLSQNPAAAAATGFDPNAALSDAHGLNVVRVAPEGEGAKIIPIRPDMAVTAPQAVETVTNSLPDPVEVALLAEPTASPRPAPQSDINAVISSAMRFVDPLPAETVAPPVVNGEADIRQAVQTALSVWPDSTRGIAADELSVRVSHLYYDGDSHSRRIFDLIASGDLSAAASALQVHADALAQDGKTGPAAELWRVYGALHMGRDDSRAMIAYARVSELDPADANIHLYLTRRYQMAGDAAKLPPVIERALGVISDPAVRTELLTPYADLQMKAGNVAAGADALEELSRLHETTSYLKPDDIAARSSHAITLARLAQAREMQGRFDVAGPLYKKAHKVFSDLSALKPEHPGLKAMADNAGKDAARFGA